MVKIVGNNLYVHKSNINELLEKVTKEDKQYILEIINRFLYEYAIIKFDKNKKQISFIESFDWDFANEPSVGKSYCIKENGEMKIIPTKNQIYHNKWMFVSDNYNGFDIEKAKQRTKDWNNIPNIKEYKNKIGYRNFWEKLLKQNNLEI